MKPQSIAQMLDEDDPFASLDCGRRASGPDSVPTTAQQLADALAEYDPFDAVEGTSSVQKLFRNSSYTEHNPSIPVTSSVCDESCQGCRFCDGVEYIHQIGIDENLDEFDDAIEEEDGVEIDIGLAVDTDDDCVELQKGFCQVEDDEAPCSRVIQDGGGATWNPSNLSFWDFREGIKGDQSHQKKHLNSSCSSCCSPLHCSTCDSNVQNPSAKKSASYIKDFAMQTTLMELGNLPCTRSCKFGKDCLRRLSIGQVYELRRRFFGAELEEAPKDKERKERALSILTECYDIFEKSFHYRIFRVNGNDYDEVCEGAFLVALGKLGNMKPNQVSKSWVEAKRIVMGTKLQDNIKLRPSNDFKLQHAGGYIDFITNLFVHQDPTKSFSAMQTVGETSPLAGYGNLIILPYDNLKQFHHEYVIHSFSRGFAAQFIAGYTTFSSAFKQRESVRFLGAKGSFNTCEICNSLNNLLKNTRKKLKKEQIRIVQEFKRLHISQQSIERKALEVRKEIALEVDDVGQPHQALIYIDGMTELTGNTPKLGAARRSKVDHVIANRVIGVEVYCGPINTVFLYNTDQMVGKGANTMIEVVRQTMSDLALELKKLGLQMPRKISWQFDNCGENKNKTMFAYASALVELGYFDAIDINFLIVGHTHSSIDQYFSVLSKAIKSAEFIGSPISLQALCSQAHKDRSRPSVNRQIEVCYNIVDALKPYINKKIKFFQVPHCFSFRRRGNKCIMFYKLFSSHDKWLPIEPELSTMISTRSSESETSHHDKLIQALATPSNHITEIEVQPLSCFDGKKAFLNHIGISDESKSNYLINSKQARNKIDAIDSVLPLIVEGEVVALHNLCKRTEAEEMEGHVFEHKELLQVDIGQDERILIQSAMKSVSSSSAKKGYVMWIVDDPALPTLDSIIPKLIHPGASIHLTASQQIEFERLKNDTRSQTMHRSSFYDHVHIEVPPNDDDDDDDGGGGGPLNTEENLFERTKKSFQQRAKDIVAVAKAALQHMGSMNGGVCLDYSYFPDINDFNGRCWEDRCYIAPEKIYFESRQSISHYKFYLECKAADALKTPWKFFMTQHIDEETLRKYQTELQSSKDAAQAMKVYLTNLQKPGLAVPSGTEVIARDGYNMTTAQLQDLQCMIEEDRNLSITRRAAGFQGRGRSRGRAMSNTTSSVHSHHLSCQDAPVHQSQSSIEIQPTVRTENVRLSAGRGRGGNRSRGVSSRCVSISNIGKNSDSKRRRCGIELCEGYCDDFTASIICVECTVQNRHLRFCSIHVLHISHSGQMGFVEHRTAITDDSTATSTCPTNEEKLPTFNQQTTSPFTNKVLNIESAVIAVTSTTETLTDYKPIRIEQDDPSEDIVPSINISKAAPAVHAAANLDVTANSSILASKSPSVSVEASLLPPGVSLVHQSSPSLEINYSTHQKKVLRLFSEGFQISQKTNISPELKIFGALDHPCYKDHLGIIATHFKLTSIEIPSASALSKKDIRAKYLNEVIKAYMSNRDPNVSEN